MRAKEPGPPIILLSFILGAILLWVLTWGAGVSIRPRSDLTRVDIVTVVLASLALMVAILTFFLGVVAFFGWSAFRTIFEERFDESVRKKFDPANKEYEDLLKKVLEDAKSYQATSLSEQEILTDDDTKLAKEL